MFKTQRIGKVLAILVVAGAMSGCATMEERDALETKVEALEKKVNMALRNAATAKVDAATALHITTSK